LRPLFFEKRKKEEWTVKRPFLFFYMKHGKDKSVYKK